MEVQDIENKLLRLDNRTTANLVQDLKHLQDNMNNLEKGVDAKLKENQDSVEKRLDAASVDLDFAVADAKASINDQVTEVRL